MAKKTLKKAKKISSAKTLRGVNVTGVTGESQ